MPCVIDVVERTNRDVMRQSETYSVLHYFQEERRKTTFCEYNNDMIDGDPLRYDDERQRRAGKKPFRRRLNGTSFLAYVVRFVSRRGRIGVHGITGGYISCT